MLQGTNEQCGHGWNTLLGVGGYDNEILQSRNFFYNEAAPTHLLSF